MQVQQNQSVSSKCVCSNCQAPLSVNPMAELAKCEYCDTVHSVASLLNESANIREAKVQAKIAEDAEAARRMWADENSRREHEWRLHKEQSDELMAFKKGKLSKVLVVCAVLSAMFAAVGFSDWLTYSGYALSSYGLGISAWYYFRYLASASVASIQTVLFVVAWLMGMQIIKEPRKNLHLALAAAGFLLYVAFLATFA